MDLPITDTGSWRFIEATELSVPSGASRGHLPEEPELRFPRAKEQTVPTRRPKQPEDCPDGERLTPDKEELMRQFRAPKGSVGTAQDPHPLVE